MTDEYAGGASDMVEVDVDVVGVVVV